MAPPAIAKIEAGLKAQKPGEALASPKSPNKVTKSVKKPKMEFSRFPTEIQQMIWGEALQKPACHTFKLVKHKDPDSADGHVLDLQPLAINHDHSSYRWWKSLLYVQNYKVADVSEVSEDEPQKTANKDVTKKPKSKGPRIWTPKGEKAKLEEDDRERLRVEKANLGNPDEFIAQRSQEAYSRLANQSFQAAFRRSMIKLQVVELRNKPGDKKGAAIDAATDLVIIDFERGKKTPPNAWFERDGLERTRDKLKQFKRVGVHYKNSHFLSEYRGPFQCWCPAGSLLNCKNYKACAIEMASFLDCFTELEAFYYVVDIPLKNDIAWTEKYKKVARRQGYQVRTSDNPQSAKYPLAHFYDLENEYLQLCPWQFIHFLPSELRDSYIWPPPGGGAHTSIQNVSDIYKGKQGNEQFVDSLSVRKRVRFGILLSFKQEN